MLIRQLRQIGLFDALMIVGLAGVVTYGGLTLIGGREKSTPRVVAAPVAPFTTTTAVPTAAAVVTTKRPPARRPTPSVPAAAPAVDPVARAAPRRDGSLRRAIGQQLVSGVDGLRAGPALLAAARAGRIGGVILFGQNITSPAQVSRLGHDLQVAARTGGNPRLFVMVDQEGGTVRRFPFAAPAPSARDVGAGPAPDQRAEQLGRQSAADLLRLGVNVNLAPVADVPSSPTNFLGTRGYSSDPATVAAAACGFAVGLADGGVIPALKHFPGLGTAGAVNTDAAAVTITTPYERLSQDWEPYRRCADTGIVMLSNASYSSLTGTTPAGMSAKAVAALRSTGFQGLTITDSLAAAGLDPYRPLATKVAQAGVDLQLYQSEGAATAAFERLLAAANDGGVSRAAITATGRRITDFKSRLRSAG